jgi:tetratricopeptide (TPR) repeat protein
LLGNVDPSIREGTQRMSPSRKSFLLIISTLFFVSGCAHRGELAREGGNRTPAGAENRASERPVTGQRSIPTTEQVTATGSYHFSMAQAYSAEGNPDRAIEEYKLALVYDPKAAVVYARLATEYIKKGMLSAAMETCKEAIAIDPEANDARMILANLYTSTQQNEEAITHFDAVLKSDPTHEEAAVYKAQALLDLSKNSDAIESMKKFVKNNPDSALGWYYLGRTYHKTSKYTDAEKAYRKAIDVKPSFTQAMLSLGFMFEEAKKPDRAIEIYKEVYDDSQETNAASRIATIYLKDEKYKQAIPYLEAVEAVDPTDMNTQVKLGLVYMETKSYEKAIATFTRLIEKNPDSDRIRFYLGSLYEELKRGDEAVTEFRKVPNASKLYADAVLHSANILKAQGKTTEAKLEVSTAISIQPQVSNFHIFLASLEEETDNIPGAISALERAYQYFPQEERVLYYLGSLYDRVGDTEKGLAKMEQLLFVNPKNVDAMNYLGYTWTILGTKMDQAESYLKTAMKLRPNNAFITDSWGWHLFVRGKYSEAIKVLEKAVALRGDEATILEHLGDAYVRANLSEKAFATYEKAVKVAKESKEKEKVAAKLANIRAVLVQNGRIKGDRTASRSPASTVSPEPSPKN